MKIRDLISDDSLDVQLLTPVSPAVLDRPVRGVVATESIAPAAYLEPDTLVLTTGMALESDDEWGLQLYVEGLVSARTAALAFGVSRHHTRVPPALRTAAIERNLPVLVVPEDLPFLRMQQTVTQTIAEARYRSTRRAWTIAEECTRRAAIDDDVQALLSIIRDRTGIDLTIVDDAGEKFVTARTRAADTHLLDVPPDVAPSTPPTHTMLLEIPLSLAGEATWTLQARVPQPAEARLLLSPAATVIAMVLTRHLTTVGASIGIDLNQLLSDPFGSSEKVKAEVGAREVPASVFIQPIRVSARTPLRQQLLARRVAALIGEAFHTLTLNIESRTIILASVSPLDDGRSAELPPDSRLRSVLVPGTRDGILIGEPLTGEDRAALSTALLVRAEAPVGLQYASSPDLTDIVNLIPAALQNAVTSAVLTPLLTAPDAAKLLPALDALVATVSLTAASARMGVHRNTMQTLRTRIEELLAVNLDDGRERAALAVAITLYSQSRPSAEAAGT